MIEAALALGRYLFLALLTIFCWQLYRLLERDLRAADRPAAPPAAREPRLVAAAGRGMAAPGRSYPVLEELTIGRLPDNTIVIDDGFCSGRHARVWCEKGTCWIEDVGSTNGTSVNGRRLQPGEARELVPGGRVELGETILRFER